MSSKLVDEMINLSDDAEIFIKNILENLLFQLGAIIEFLKSQELSLI